MWLVCVLHVIKDWFIHDLPVIALCLLRVVCMKFVFSMERVSLLYVSIWLMQCLLCDLCGAYGFLKAFYQICVFVFCLILCVCVCWSNVWTMCLLYMFNFRFCYMFFLRNVSWLLYFVGCSVWTHPLDICLPKCQPHGFRPSLDGVVYFGLLRWSTRKCKHTDCGEAGFLLKTAQNNH